MISILAFDIRRVLRRRLSMVVLLVPAVLVAYAAAASWRHHPMLPLTPPLIILTSSLLIFGQALLSDREACFGAALSVAPLPHWFPLFRRAAFAAVPFIVQLLIYRGLMGMFHPG